MHRSLRPKWGKALAGSEEDLAREVQSGYLNFYTPETVNPFVALAARGPWIITTHGAVIHEDIVQTSYDIIDEPPEDFMEPQSSLPRFDGWASDDGWMFGISGDF